MTETNQKSILKNCVDLHDKFFPFTFVYILLYLTNCFVPYFVFTYVCIPL